MRGYQIKPGQESLAFPKMARKKRRIKSDNPESILQVQCEKYLELLRLEYLHFPNSMWCTIMQSRNFGVINECSDHLRNWPDLLIFDGKGRYLAIELKSKIGRESHGQKDKKRSLGGLVLRTFEDFKAEVDKWNG